MSLQVTYYTYTNNITLNAISSIAYGTNFDGTHNIYNAKSVSGIAAPYGIAFISKMDPDPQNPKNCIELIKNTAFINSNDIIEASIYSAIGQLESIYINMQINNSLECQSNLIKKPITSVDKSAYKQIYKVGYQFDTNVKNFRIGFKENNCRLCSFIIKKANTQDEKNVNNYYIVLQQKRNDIVINSQKYIIGEDENNIQYKYIFNYKSDDSLKILIYQNDNMVNNKLVASVPFTIHENNSENMSGGEYALYFTIKKINDTFSITNILINDRISIPISISDNLKETNIPHIEVYLPVNVASVQRLSLLHNTEVFINYQE